MESGDDVMLMAEEKMTKCVEHLHTEFSALRTGKASPALVENVSVLYYGTPTRMKELAGITTPEPRLIIIKPYDPSVLGDIEKAISAANLGVTPRNDGKIIRVPIPELSGERRAEIIKVAKRLAEECRIAVRNLRREANEAIKELEKNSKISEDDKNHALKEIQESTDRYIKEVDQRVAAKEKELMEV